MIKNKTKSYERRDYETVDEKSLSYAMSLKMTKKRIWSIKGQEVNIWWYKKFIAAYSCKFDGSQIWKHLQHATTKTMILVSIYLRERNEHKILCKYLDTYFREINMIFFLILLVPCNKVSWGISYSMYSAVIRKKFFYFSANCRGGAVLKVYYFMALGRASAFM